MANQHTRNTERRKFLAFVTSNPSCSTREVADAFGLASRHLGSELECLARQGLIRAERDGRRMYWTATGKQPPDTQRGEVPRQIVTRSWAAQRITSNWLDFAICAPARQLQGEIA